MTDTSLVLRGVTPDDETAWRLLWAGYLTFYGAQLAPAVTEVTWARLLDAAEPLRGIVAAIDGGRSGSPMSRCTDRRGPKSRSPTCKTCSSRRCIAESVPVAR